MKKIFLCLGLLVFGTGACCKKQVLAPVPTPTSDSTEKNNTQLDTWNPGAVRSAIVDFVKRVTTKGPDFVAPEKRIAVFDYDGTLICEKPVYTNFYIALDKLKERVAKDPSLAECGDERCALYKAAKADDWKTLRKDPPGMHLEAFAGEDQNTHTQATRHMIATRQHPRFKRPLPQVAYAPMLEFVAYLQAHGFQVFVVSASQQEFVRTMVAEILGLPPWQVIGSSIYLSWRPEHSPPRFVRQREWFGPRNWGEGKPDRIRERIGGWPILAVGNSNGDFAMLDMTAKNQLPHLVMVLNHDDPEREYEYKKGDILEKAQQAKWTIISIKKDFKQVFR